MTFVRILCTSAFNTNSLRSFRFAQSRSYAIKSSMEGQTILVTGSTDGIGKHTARKLAFEKARVLIHGRNPQRVEETVKEIMKETGNSSIEGYVYDLASLTSIRAFAEDLRAKNEKIDILINNAGVFQVDQRTSEDGFEYTWAVNVIAPYVIICLLLDKVTSRIINVSSISACNRLDFDNLQQEKGYSVHDAYSISKLCMMLITFYLAKRIKPFSDVTVNCLDPGTVNTKMLIAGWGPIGIPISEADHEFFLATDPSVANVSGEYFINDRIRKPPSTALETSVQDRLVALLEEQTGETLDPTKAIKKADVPR